MAANLNVTSCNILPYFLNKMFPLVRHGTDVVFCLFSQTKRSIILNIIRTVLSTTYTESQ